MSEVIKALTIIQPWASAIAVGAKTIETRSWATKHRGTLLIHAGKSTAYLPRLLRRGAITRRHDLKAIGEDVINIANLPDPYHRSHREREKDYPLGALIAVAELVDCMEIRRDGMNTSLAPKPDPYNNTGWEMQTRSVSDTEHALGDFSPGRYAWVLSNVRALPEPIPYRGRQGLFNVPAEILAGSGVVL